LRGIDQSQKFVSFKALRNLAQDAFQSHRGFRILSGVVLGCSGLKLTIQCLGIESLPILNLASLTLALLTAGCCYRQACQQGQQDKPQRPVSNDHGLRMLAPHPRKGSSNKDWGGFSEEALQVNRLFQGISL
jgi:hypothetical protein